MAYRCSGLCLWQVLFEEVLDKLRPKQLGEEDDDNSEIHKSDNSIVEDVFNKSQRHWRNCLLRVRHVPGRQGFQDLSGLPRHFVLESIQ